MLFIYNIVMEVPSIYDVSKFICMTVLKNDELIVFLLLTISISNTLHQTDNSSYGGYFADEEKTMAIAFEPNSFLHYWGNINTMKERFGIGNNSNSIRVKTGLSNHTIQEKSKNDFYYFNWIFETGYVMLVCLLILRNLRNISLSFLASCSALNERLQKLCYSCIATSRCSKSNQQRKRKGIMSETRRLSYIFAMLTWRASQTSKIKASSREANLRHESAQNLISYGHITTIGDLLLLVLFTHVYYQKQKFHQGVDDDASSYLENVLQGHKKKNQSSRDYQKLYDRYNKSDSNNAFNYPNRRGPNKRPCHFCGNIHQQMLSPKERKSSQVKIASIIPILTYCTGIVWHTCCFCQYSCRLCCYCYSCFHKLFKSSHDVHYQYCCYLCCLQNMCHISDWRSYAIYRFSCHFYCACIYNMCWCYNHLLSKAPSRAADWQLLHKMKNASFNIYSSYTNCSAWKIAGNKRSYLIIQGMDEKKYSFFCMANDKYMFVYKRSCHQFPISMFSSRLPQIMLITKNCQSVLKWKKFHVVAMVMALILIYTSNAGLDYNYYHCYSSFLSKRNKNFASCQQSKKQHQQCQSYRPQLYFCTILIQCVKRQKIKIFHKTIFHKFNRKNIKLPTPSTQNYEQSLPPTTTSSKAAIVWAVKRVRGIKQNILWLVIGLIWFEGLKMINCNVIINYENQQQYEQHHQTGNSHKEIKIKNNVNSNFVYKIENFNQMKTKNSYNKSNNYNKNKTSSSSNNDDNNKNKINYNSNSTNNISATSNNINVHLPDTVIPTKHFKHYCYSSYHQKLIRSSQRDQRALKTNPNLDTSATSSGSINCNNFNADFNLEHTPSSALQTISEESHSQSDLMRLESIKHHILVKLGLVRKPNVSHPLPKQFIWDTIYRADGIKSFHEFSNTNNVHNHQHLAPQPSYHYWSTTSSKDFNVVPMEKYQQQQQQQRKYFLEASNIKAEGGIDNIKRTPPEVVDDGRKKYGKNKQQLMQQQQKQHPQKEELCEYNNNDIIHRKEDTSAAVSKIMNDLLHTKPNRNRFMNKTNKNKTVNEFNILKQHKKFHENSQHIIITPITTKKTTTPTQQQKQKYRRQYVQISQDTNNNNIDNNIYNTNNVNNSKITNDNSIIMVQKHLHNNKKYIEERKKFTYLIDTSGTGDSLSNMEEEGQQNIEFDNNNSTLIRKNHHHYQHQNQSVLPLQKKFRDDWNEKLSGKYQRIDIDDIVSVADDVNTDGRGGLQPDITDFNKGNGDNDSGDDGHADDNNDDDGEIGQHHRNNQYKHHHENYFWKLEDAFDRNEHFFESSQEIITFAEKGKMYKHHRLVEFSHQSNEKPKQTLRVRNAEIHIRIDKIRIKHKSRSGTRIKRKRLKIWIFELIENNYAYKGFERGTQFCASFDVDTSRLGWKKFDITSTIKEWYSREEEKLRLLIDCTGCGRMYSVHLFNDINVNNGNVNLRERSTADDRRNININDITNKQFYNVIRNNDNYTNLHQNQTLVTSENGEVARGNGPDDTDEDALNSSRPFLVLHTEVRKQRRVRRRAINCNGALHGQCCKESFYVSFKALGWDDWIIAPRGYFANYCRGDCTGSYRTPDTFQTFHAHFIEEYRKMGVLNEMQPCCAPIKFSSMSLIYYGDEGIIKRDLPKMVVDECGCP